MNKKERLFNMWVNKNELVESEDATAESLKPNQILLMNNGSWFTKLYHAMKPEANKIPKPFPMKSGLTLAEDEWGWYNIVGMGELAIE